MCNFFFNDTATTEIYTLSLHDALPIYETESPRGRHEGSDRRGLRDRGPQGGEAGARRLLGRVVRAVPPGRPDPRRDQDRKSTRLNSSHANISYAVFCLKKKFRQTLCKV